MRVGARQMMSLASWTLLSHQDPLFYTLHFTLETQALHCMICHQDQGSEPTLRSPFGHHSLP
jgi:hypothetical protein